MAAGFHWVRESTVCTTSSTICTYEWMQLQLKTICNCSTCSISHYIHVNHHVHSHYVVGDGRKYFGNLVQVLILVVNLSSSGFDHNIREHFHNTSHCLVRQLQNMLMPYLLRPLHVSHYIQHTLLVAFMRKSRCGERTPQPPWSNSCHSPLSLQFLLTEKLVFSGHVRTTVEPLEASGQTYVLPRDTTSSLQHTPEECN